MKRFQLRAGFTLVELLIAIAILAILSAGVLVAINPAKRQNQAEDAQIKSDIGQIATAAQSYFSSGIVGSYPTNLTVLVTNSDLKNLPTPPNSVSYEYAVTGDGGGRVTVPWEVPVPMPVFRNLLATLLLVGTSGAGNHLQAEPKSLLPLPALRKLALNQ
ncbi:prepilin-type N-terminal cleavage/methylation domain-containing protein [Candidatus Curtissbacteria bacterium]|nr:prepilin-type N-terminal cleavage/methylation domain-containing protein [Candidatus Curtissbacteria bacterium]